MTVIVPIDFSAQSVNAASFASKMLTGVYGADLVLYHLYDDDNEADTAKQYLLKIKKTLSESSIVKCDTKLRKEPI